ncbi:Uncharacterized protein putative in bacteria [Rubellimicrobium thermophilum DSM 16684]|uniref:Uncharacterized protein putative in bacteria n=1 Tax=Rubellimicrobium thermophilum DSM 16684 TaxID=1123069 RepID=S9R0P3_9RHOB|nr:hypothetical protein [Rubellimicrobium thermophilum]EPX87196.1 Uncharacterized protein putative in bacteria [Rubellimicrobium thermophilum DSM 16684]
MASSNDSFIDEVSEALRRDRMARWLRRWGWLVALLILAIVGGAGWWEWHKARQQALAELRGDTLLAALGMSDGAGRLAALEAIADQGVVAALLLAAERQQQGDAAGAAAAYRSLAEAAETPPLYRDMAALKALMIEGTAADRSALEALAAPGAPFRLLALEQLALVEIATGETEAGTARLEAILSDAEAPATQQQRVDALLTALRPAAPSPDATQAEADSAGEDAVGEAAGPAAEPGTGGEGE